MESIDVSNDHDGMRVNGDPTVMDILMKELQPSTVTPGDSDYAFGVGNKYQGLSRQEFKMTIVLECFLVLYQEVHLVPGLNRAQSVSTLHRLQTCPSCRCSYRQPHITNLPLGQALFGRLEDQSGIADANYFLLQAALLEERINDGAKIAEEGLELARKSGNKLDEVKMLRASLLVKLAEGKPLDALEIAAKAEGLLVTLEKKHKEAGEVLLLVAQAHMLQGTTVGQQAALNAALQAVDHFAKAEEGRGEADSWRVVGDARVALGKFEDGLRATEAAMVICVDCGDEVGQALCLLSLSKAHLVRGLPLKAKKSLGESFESLPWAEQRLAGSSGIGDSGAGIDWSRAAKRSTSTCQAGTAILSGIWRQVGRATHERQGCAVSHFLHVFAMFLHVCALGTRLPNHSDWLGVWGAMS